MAKDLKFSEYPFKVPNEKVITAKCEKLVKDIVESKDAKACIAGIKKWNKYSNTLNTQCSIIYVLYSCETSNKKYKKAQDKVNEISPLLSNYSNKIAKFITSSSFRPELEKKFGAYLLQMYDASLKAFDEKIIPELIEENKLTSEYEEILGGAQIDFDGKVLNLSQLGKYMQDKDQSVRKAAAIAMDTWLGEHEEAIGSIYDKLVHLRDSMAKKLGYENFTELGYLRLGRTDYNAKMVAGYRAQIARDVVPVCNKLYKVQMKNLGIKNPQYYDYNLMFKSGNPTPAGEEKYLVGKAFEMYSALGQESKEFFQFMMDHELLDLTARKGKTTGGYCTSFQDYKAPFIFSNFNGTSGDVNVLTHEGGHAFQYYLSRDIKVPEYINPTLESCEIHSMSMEFFAWPYMEGFFGKDAEKYKYSHLCDAIEFLPYGITIDEFQHWVYENPNATHDERCAKFHEIESRYTPHKKYDFTPTLAKGTYWLRQAHVFGSPFYYIDYTLAQVCAFQFANENLKNHDKAWKKYVKLCKCGGKYPFLTLLEKNHIRNPFVDGTVKKAIKPLEKVLKTFDTSKF
ncbi:MAG: M3 family oligoendopeptidase [Bacilli bacterium]|nr:M3 family oligoendopeptidase [Bacilli bacterium]